MSETDDPYRAPQSNVTESSSEQFGGSIDNTLGGNAELDIGAVFSEAWGKTNGIKGYVVGGGILLYLAAGVVSVIVSFLFGLGGQDIAGVLVGQLVTMMMIYPFIAGVFLLGLHQSVGMPVSFAQQFNQYGMMLPILGIALIQTLASLIIPIVGVVLLRDTGSSNLVLLFFLVLPSIYVAFAFALAIPLKVEKQLGVIESIITSMQLVNKKFFSVAVLALVSSIVSVLSFITIIGWIWAIPWMLMVFAITYRQLAGVSVAT
ncbi:MAG: hypothetical protein O7G86_16100 [Gammaproteobacteria bacterium]|nr:hypothetical protein [Gammaproteobacteria bacterium]